MSDSSNVIAELERRLRLAEARAVRAETASVEVEARYRLLAERWAQAVWETGPTGAITTDSPSWRIYTGQTLDEWLGFGWLTAVHLDDRAYAERQWREALAARTPVNAEFRVRDADGRWRWTNVLATPLLDAAGDVERWLGLNVDIDARRRAEDALRASEEKYRSLFETMDQGVSLNEIVRDADGRAIDIRYLEHNPALERLTGVPASAAIGRLASEVFPGLDRFWIDAVDRVVSTGVGEKVEHELSSIGRWYQAKFFPVGNDRCVSLFDDITDRKRAELLLRASEERQSFLLELGDAIRPQSTAAEKIRVAARLLGEKLDASRILYAEYDWNQGIAHIFNGWFADGAQPFPTEMRLQDYDGEILLDLKAGRTVRVDNVGLLADEPGYAAIASVGVQALLSPPLMIDGTLAMNISVHQHDPRHWTDDEVALVQEVVERLWAEIVRARAEAALRTSEERFRQFAAASAAGLWMRRADTLAMEYTSPAVEAIYGTDADELHGDIKRWAALIVPEDRERAVRHLECARRGESTVHEFRIRRRSDQAFRWIRDTDFPLADAEGTVERVGGIVEDVTDAKLAVEHQGVLLAELQHRVRNIMAMIRSIMRRSADGAVDVEAYQALLEGRLLALARVQVLLTRKANIGGALREIVDSEVGAQALDRAQFGLVGPDVQLSPKAAEVLTLAFHELATNAVKYGALSVPQGRLSVEWATFEKRGRSWLAIDWVEEGAPPREPVTRRGFGSDLIEGKIPYELGGSGRISVESGGARCHMEFPLSDGESILETDSPPPAIVFGGMLDMSGAPDLSGRRVLIVEDDYYIAGDTAAALAGAGATVIGPCPSEDATLDLLETITPTHAVLDLNLGGGGPRFEIAHALRNRGVPFIFLTGYDPDVIPPELAGVVRLQKPVVFRDVVEAVSRL